MTDQKRTGLDWEDIRVFAALARHGSLSAAARALLVNHATIARRVQSLQAALGERLVERRPDGYVLTPAGTRTLIAATDMEVAAAAMGRSGPDNSPRGLVRINAPPSLSQRFLVPRLARLSRQHPGLDIDVATGFRAVSLERREADIAVRLGRPEDGDVIAKRLAPLGFGFYASAAYLDQVDRGMEAALIGFDEANAYLPEAAWLARHFPGMRVAFRATGQIAQAAAAKESAGIALLPHFVVQKEDRLIPCQLNAVPPARDIWLITRRQDRKDLPIRLVSDFLSELFEQETGLFEGPSHPSAFRKVKLNARVSSEKNLGSERRKAEPSPRRPSRK
jgi:DNA-binding transcriptional LysR family regulator